jgi:hypothetical protein
MFYMCMVHFPSIIIRTSTSYHFKVGTPRFRFSPCQKESYDRIFNHLGILDYFHFSCNAVPVSTHCNLSLYQVLLKSPQAFSLFFRSSCIDSISRAKTPSKMEGKHSSCSMHIYTLWSFSVLSFNKIPQRV